MNNNHQCHITMFPAKDGDCFFLEFINGNNEFCIMIDAGPVSFGNNELKNFVKSLRKGKKIDLLLISHFDRDHIGGALPLLRNEEVYCRIGEIWHNGLCQIAPNLDMAPTEDDRQAICSVRRMYQETNPPESGYISAGQSLEFSKLLAARQIPVNRPMNGQAITSQTSCLTLGKDQDIEIFFLLPKQERLDALMDLFESKILDMNLKAKPVFTNEAEDAFFNLMCSVNSSITEGSYISGEEDQISNLSEYAKKIPEQDDSVTNAASIAIIIRYHGKKMLFAGDAIAEDLVPALARWRDEMGENLVFDVVKLPHHGSGHNCPILLDMPGFDGKLFLISTNGKHGHPDKETISRLIFHKKKYRHDIAVNYMHQMYAPLFSNYMSANDDDYYSLRVCQAFHIFEEKEI